MSRDPKKPQPSVAARIMVASGLAAPLDRIGFSDSNAVCILSEDV